MGWILVFFLLACIFFVGCSFKTFLLYVIITGLSFGLTCLFVSNKWGLDGLFEEIFKAVELFGFGVPLRLESRIAYSPLYTDGGSETLEELPKPLEEELRKLMANIIRDFIRTWYEDVGKGDHFIAETQELIEILCIESYRRASQIDSHYLVEQVILIFHGHLERFNKAMAIVKAKDPKLRLSISSSQLLCQTYESQLKFERPALTSAAKELSYLRNVIDCLLAAMVPKDTFNCDTGRFILREILAVQVMSQLVQLLIDPDWICEAVIEVLTDRVSAKPQDFDVRNSSNDLGTGQFDGATNVDKQEVDDHLQRYDSVENTSSVKSIKTEEVLSQEREDSLDDVGDRIEITSPEICGDSPDCLPPWPVTSSRQPPIGESQHDNAESYLVISVEENRENSNAEQNQNGNSWSVEVVPPSSLESIGSSSLTSSWTCCPSSDDESFNEISFEEIKEKLSKAESYDNTGTALQGLKEMTCCYTSETNDKEYPSLSLVAQRGSSDEGSDVEDAPCTSLRTRSLSLPGTDEREVDSEQSLSSCIELTRSDSAPCTLSFTNIKKQDDEELYIPDSPRKAFGSPFYQTSFCSSSGSFKSISSDEDVVGSYIENSEEVLEDAFDIDPFTPQTQVKLSRSRMVKQASFDEPSDRVTSDSSVDELVVQKAILPTYNQDKEDSLDLSSNTEKSVLGNANEDNARGADKGDQRISGSVFETQESEFSFGDVVLNAGKKFVSNFKPPFKFDSLSTSSTKSSEVSDRESMDCTADSQSRGYPQGMPVNTANTTAVMHATSDGMRRLSRSHAILEESMESDVGTCYGTPKEELERKKVHVDDVAQDCSSIEGIKRMHPSELISIPNTVVALETTWEPGRNKYTLYKIEYDIRIWHEVHSAAIKQARSDAKKERMKRRLYDDPMHNKEVGDDDEMSLDKIKRRVLLKRIINRRYREFMELHNRLTNGPLSVHMKDILRPNRKYNLPFGRLDPHVVEGRRKLLQYYLGSLISKPPLRNSEDLKQFLGVTEGKKISFIKPSVAQIVTQSVHVPRVDKMLSRQMTKVIDSIKTAFDSVEEGENLPDEPSLEGNDRTIVPWKLADQDTLKASPEADVNQGTDFSMHCFSAFLSDRVESSLPSSPSPLPGGKQEIFDEKDAGELWGKKNKVMPFDMNKEAGLWESYFKVSQHLGPRTAGDGSDNPDELSSTFPSNSPSFAQLAKTLGLHSDESKSEGSGAAFKRYLDVQSGYHEHQRPVQHLCVSQSLPRSKSMERISSEAMQGKFQFKPQKIFEAAKRIGQGNKSVSMESLEMASTEREKKRGALKKLFKEAPAKVFGRGPKKQKHVTEGMGDVPSPVGHPFDEEKPNALSAIDPPSSLDEMSFTNRASGGSDLQCPLSDAILSLLCELLKDHDSWLTINRVHQCFSATLGGLLEWCVQREIDNITSDDSWALYLNTLIEAIWPQGKLIEGAKKTKSEMEKARTRKEAVIALMDAFPGFVKLFIGPRAYQQIAVNVIECLQYPQLNKVMLYTILELVLSEFVPEIQESLPFFKGIGTQK